MAQDKLITTNNFLKSQKKYSEEEREELQSEILGVFFKNKFKRVNRKKIIANSKESRNLFTRKQTVNKNDIDGKIEQAQKILECDKLQD